MRALIIGCGYLGRRVAEKWMGSGHEVRALTRTRKNADGLKAAGIQPYVGDVLDPESLATLPETDALLYAVGYDRSSNHSKENVYVNGLNNVLTAVSGRVARVIYISSTSVYGQSDGSWIDEESDCEPSTESGRICLAAEQTLRTAVDEGRIPARMTILRLAGLYGPGRLIGRLDQLQSGAAVAGDPEAWLNLIHVEDAARCVIAAADRARVRPVYLIADDEPVRRGEFYAELARRAGAPAPTFDPGAAAGGRVSGMGKRCRNRLMHEELVERLMFPDFRAGLASAL